MMRQEVIDILISSIDTYNYRQISVTSKNLLIEKNNRPNIF